MADSRVTLRRMEIADQRWRAAVGDSAFAPPNDGLPTGCEPTGPRPKVKRSCCLEAATSPQLRWSPTPKDRGPKSLSYELRPDGNRPGPSELWEEFDQVIDQIADAQAGTDFAAIGTAFCSLGDVATRLAGAVDQERGQTRARQTG